MYPRPDPETSAAYRWHSNLNTDPNRTYIGFTNHARQEMEDYEMDTINVMDMLDNSFPCHRPYRHRREDVEVCANRDNICYRIILGEDYCPEVQEYCWSVKHVKPA